MYKIFKVINSPDVIIPILLLVILFLTDSLFSEKEINKNNSKIIFEKTKEIEAMKNFIRNQEFPLAGMKDF